MIASGLKEKKSCFSSVPLPTAFHLIPRAFADSIPYIALPNAPSSFSNIFSPLKVSKFFIIGQPFGETNFSV
jgi:hypothetical protein